MEKVLSKTTTCFAFCKSLILTAFIFTVSVLTLTACQPAQSGWTLVSGMPPYADPSPIVYEGEVLLKGYFTEIPAYISEITPHFYVLDLKNLPEGIEFKSNNFQLKNIAPEVMKTLKKSSSENPIEITVDKLIIQMEGNPSLYLTTNPTILPGT